MRIERQQRRSYYLVRALEQHAGALARDIWPCGDRHQLVQHVSKDSAMADPDQEVEFSDFTDNDVESGATAPATRIRKKYKMRASERDARVQKKTKGKASTDA